MIKKQMTKHFHKYEINKPDINCKQNNK